MVILYLILFIFGISIGSFLNVVLDRKFLNEKDYKNGSIVNTYSVCASCGHRLSFLDLIPLLSFLFLKGKCRYCGKKIPWRIFLVEITTGILFVLYLNYRSLSFLGELNFWFILQFVYDLFIISVLVLIFFIDLKKMIIPNRIIFPLISLCLILEPFWAWKNLKHGVLRLDLFWGDFYWAMKMIYEAIFQKEFLLEYHSLPTINGIFNPIVSGVLIFIVFGIIYLLSKGKGIGFGDVKFSFFMGLFLGFQKVWIAFYLAFILGASVSLVLIIKRQKTLKQKIPLGPFLVMGILLAFLYGDFFRVLIQKMGELLTVF